MTMVVCFHEGSINASADMSTALGTDSHKSQLRALPCLPGVLSISHAFSGWSTSITSELAMVMYASVVGGIP